MKVLIAEGFEASGLEGLQAAGCEVDYRPDARGEVLQQALADLRRGRAHRAIDPGD